MTIAEFRIVPDGIHPLLLGMSRSQVEQAMNETPDAGKSRIVGEEVLYFAQARVVMRDDRVVEIGLSPPARVYLRGKLLFDDPTIWRELLADDGDAQESLGFIVLRKLGLTLTGFHDDDPAQLAVTAFEAGRWDALRQEMKPFNPDA